MYRLNLYLILAALLALPGTGVAKSCKAYRSCADVIADYPDGKFGRKDADKDGIPCENVCSRKKQVQKLQRKVSKQ